MDKSLLTITTGSHYFKVTNSTYDCRVLTSNYARMYTRMGLERKHGRFVKVPTAVFAAATACRDEYRFHINLLGEFKNYLRRNNIPDALINQVVRPACESQDIDVKMKDIWTLREDQIPVFEYLTGEQAPVARFVGIQTGKGKSLISSAAMAHIGKKIVIMVRPMYIAPWVEGIQKYINVEPDEIMVVQGGDHLKSLLEMTEDGRLDKYKVIIVSNKTYQNYLKTYEVEKHNFEEHGYSVIPEDFFPALKAGMRLIDEVHLDFHLNFKIDLYTHIENSISLSATLENKDPFLSKMYSIAYRKGDRYAGGVYSKYSTATAVLYGLSKATAIRATEYGATNYSHNAFEVSIMKDARALNNYCELVSYIIDVGFLRDYAKGQKCAIYAYTTEMCDYMAKFIRKKYPQFTTKRFVSKDPIEDLYDPDIRVTTLGSGGTAHDISNLTTVILTTSVDSIQSNLQVFGRLREIKGVETRFFYFACGDVPKQMEYHNNKVDLFKQTAKGYKEIHAPYRI